MAFSRIEGSDGRLLDSRTLPEPSAAAALVVLVAEEDGMEGSCGDCVDGKVVRRGEVERVDAVDAVDAVVAVAVAVATATATAEVEVLADAGADAGTGADAEVEADTD